jgi:nicotinate dehydrogenase subunit B
MRVSDRIDWHQGQFRLHTGKVDIGQRITSALRIVVAQELGLRLDQVAVAQMRTGVAPDEGVTSGSASVSQSGGALRLAAATLRGALAGVAARRLNVAVGDLMFADGFVGPAADGRELALGDLMADIPEGLQVDPNAEFTPPGAMPEGEAMRGIGAICDGSYHFVSDIDMPGMWHARNIRPPHFHARLTRLDPKVVQRTQAAGMAVIRDGNWLAVAGPEEWQVLRAAERLARAATWDRGDGLPEGDPLDRLNSDKAQRFPLRDGMPLTDRPVPPELDAPDHAARYERPYQMHAALAPSAAFAIWRRDGPEITCHGQGIYGLRAAIADGLGLAPEQVRISHAPGAGCFGHNGADDAAYEAALIARTLPGTPILLKWTRAEEHGWEPYAPAMAVEIAARLTPEGRIAEWSAEAFSDTHRGRPSPEPDEDAPFRLLANHLRGASWPAHSGSPSLKPHAGVHRNLTPVYDFPHTRLVKNLVVDGVHRVSAMRCLGAAANIFATESFLDEICARTGADPFELRLSQLSDPRARAVLERLRADLPGDGSWGIAYGQYKNATARVAVAANVLVSETGTPRVQQLRIVADAGRIVDPDGVTAQLEGGALQAVGWALSEAVTWDRDAITSLDWDSYKVMRFDTVPDVHVTLIDRADQPSVGVGEASPGPALAAIAGGIHAATGLRLRRLPFTQEALRRAAAG